MNARRVPNILAALLIAGLSFAQGATVATAQEPPPLTADRQPAPPRARVAFGNLADGDVVPPTFLVQFEVIGLDVAPAGTAVPNSGHHHLLINVPEIPNPDLPLPTTDNIRDFGNGQTWTELTLPEGDHTLQLVFADSRHIPHEPVVKSGQITITVDRDAAE